MPQEKALTYSRVQSYTSLKEDLKGLLNHVLLPFFVKSPEELAICELELLALQWVIDKSRMYLVGYLFSNQSYSPGVNCQWEDSGFAHQSTHSEDSRQVIGYNFRPL